MHTTQDELCLSKFGNLGPWGFRALRVSGIYWGYIGDYVGIVPQ